MNEIRCNHGPGSVVPVLTVDVNLFTVISGFVDNRADFFQYRRIRTGIVNRRIMMSKSFKNDATRKTRHFE